MTIPSPHRRPIAIAALAATLACALVAPAAGATLEFVTTGPATTASPFAPAATSGAGYGPTAGYGAAGAGYGAYGAGAAPIMGTPAKLGTKAKRLEFRTDRRARRTIALTRTAIRQRAQAEGAWKTKDTATARRLVIDDLLREAEGDAELLQANLEARLVDRYQRGDAGTYSFLLSADGMSELGGRAKIMRDQLRRDQQLARDYRFSLRRLEALELAYDELSVKQGDRALRFEDSAQSIDERVAAIEKGHMEAPVPVDKDAGVAGTWYITDGAFDVPLFMPSSTSSGYDGGNVSARRQPRPDQIARVLSDPRIELDSTGVQDIQGGEIDGRLLDGLSALADQSGRIIVTSLKRDHGTYTSGGNVSMHAYGCAADIGTVGSTLITGGAQTPGGDVEMAVRFLASLPGDMAPHQVISLFDLGGSTLRMGDHDDHIHLGYSC